MSTHDDDLDMADHTWADRLLAGEPVDDDRGLSGVVAAVLATADRPAPAPSAALALVLREGLPPVTESVPEQRRAAGAGRALLPASLLPASLLPGSLLPGSLRPAAVRRWSSRTVRVAAASVAATLAMGAGVATAEVRGVSTLDYVPEPVRRSVDAAVSAVASVFTADPPAPVQDVAPAPAAPPAPAQAPDERSLPSAPAVLPSGTAATPAPTTSAPPTSSGAPAAPSAAPTAPVPVAPSTPAAPDGSPAPDPAPSPSPSGSDREPLSEPTPGPSATPSDAPTGEPTASPSAESEVPAPPPAPAQDRAPEADASEPGAGAAWDRPAGPRRSVGDRLS